MSLQTLPQPYCTCVRASSPIYELVRICPMQDYSLGRKPTRRQSLQDYGGQDMEFGQAVARRSGVACRCLVSQESITSAAYRLGVIAHGDDVIASAYNTSCHHQGQVEVILH
jgi:hypothetical protein